MKKAEVTKMDQKSQIFPFTWLTLSVVGVTAMLEESLYISIMLERAPQLVA